MSILIKLIEQLPNTPQDQWLSLIQQAVEEQAKVFEGLAIEFALNPQVRYTYLECADYLRNKEKQEEAAKNLGQRMFNRELEMGVRPTLNDETFPYIKPILEEKIKQIKNAEAAYTDDDYNIALIIEEHYMSDYDKIIETEEELSEKFGAVNFYVRAHQGRGANWYGELFSDIKRII